MNVPLENVQNKDFGNASETTLASQLKQALETLLGSFHQEKKMIEKKQTTKQPVSSYNYF